MENMQLEILNLIIKSMAVSINRAESAIQMMRTGQAYPGDVTPLLDEFLLIFQNEIKVSVPASPNVEPLKIQGHAGRRPRKIMAERVGMINGYPSRGATTLGPRCWPRSSKLTSPNATLAAARCERSAP